MSNNNIPPIAAEPKKKTIQDVLSEDKGDDNFDFPVEFLEKADLTLPPEFEADIMAAEMLAHLANYKKFAAANKAARHSGDHARAEQMYKELAFSRMAVAIIQATHPKAKVIADEIAIFRAQKAALERKAVLAEE